jgi:hypothetical protein
MQIRAVLGSMIASVSCASRLHAQQSGARVNTVRLSAMSRLIRWPSDFGLDTAATRAQATRRLNGAGVAVATDPRTTPR